MGLFTGHANLRYMLHKMGEVKSPLCRKCGANKSVNILGEDKNPRNGADRTRPDEGSETE